MTRAEPLAALGFIASSGAGAFTAPIVLTRRAARDITGIMAMLSEMTATAKLEVSAASSPSVVAMPMPQAELAGRAEQQARLDRG